MSLRVIRSNLTDKPCDEFFKDNIQSAKKHGGEDCQNNNENRVTHSVFAARPGDALDFVFRLAQIRSEFFYGLHKAI